MYNLKRYGSLTDAEIHHALRWNTDPLIAITDLSGNQCGSPAVGCFNPVSPDQIEIDPQYVQDFENDPYGSGLGHNAVGGKVFIAGHILLHELCHWGCFKHGAAEAGGEAGDTFEAATYGRCPMDP